MPNGIRSKCKFEIKSFIFKQILPWLQSSAERAVKSAICEKPDIRQMGLIITKMNLAQWLKKCCLKYKRQRLDFCEEFTVWHFATKCAAVKLVKPWMSIHFSFETRNLSHVVPAMWSECLKKGSRDEPASYTQGKADQVMYLHLRTLLDLVLVWSQQNYLNLLTTVSHFKFF